MPSYKGGDILSPTLTANTADDGHSFRIKRDMSHTAPSKMALPATLLDRSYHHDCLRRMSRSRYSIILARNQQFL